MKFLVALVTLLLVQSISTLSLTHDQVPPFHFRNYFITKSSVRGTEKTNVNFEGNHISFRHLCNTHFNQYKVEGDRFSVGQHWGASRIGCPQELHRLDREIVRLFNEANQVRSHLPQNVDFLRDGKWLFTISAHLQR